MRLLLAREFIESYFDPAYRPDERTIYAAVKRGPHDANGLPGRIIGRLAYVDVDAVLSSTGNAIADKILAAPPAANSGENISPKKRLR